MNTGYIYICQESEGIYTVGKTQNLDYRVKYHDIIFLIFVDDCDKVENEIKQRI